MSRKRFGDWARWEVVRQLDEGGQGWIYEVRDTSGTLSQPLVLKRLKNRTRLDRFRREIEAHQRLNHSGIASLIDFSLDDPPFLVAPLYEGPTLEQIAPLEPLRALDLFLKLCDVVQYAHNEGVFHRDLKPSNVILNKDEKDVIVIDFGLCYFVDEDERLTETTEQIGSRYYIAPELEGGRANEVTSAADVYGLGKTLYFLLTGKHVAREAITGENDLVHLTGNRQLKYVADRILRKSIAVDAEQRSSVESLSESAKIIHRLIREHYYPGPDREGALCRFCGEGSYEKGPPMSIAMRMAGTSGDFVCKTLVCSSCKHVEWFRT